MSYLSVVSLADAKTFLRIDDTLNDDDSQITSMINSACRMIEKRTNHLFYARSKTYLFQEFCVYVYDYPINSVTSPTDTTETKYELYNIYETNSSANTELVLNVGYSDPAEVPDELIQCVLEMVKFMYYEAESNKVVYGMLPIWLQNAIDYNKRFII